MGCRSTCYLCYFTFVGALFMFASFYAFTVSRSAADCTLGCALTILTGSHACSSPPSAGDAAAIEAAFDERCFVCGERDRVFWPCPETFGREDCRDAGGALLATESCGALAGTSSTIVDAVRTELGSQAAEGACIQFLARDAAFDPNSALPTSGQRLSYANMSRGPGIQVIVSDASLAGSSRSPACAEGVIGSDADIGRGRMCYTVPQRFNLRALLVPGLWGFMITFLAQAMCSIGSGIGLVCFRRIRGEGWIRLSRPTKYVGACVRRMPQVLCLFHLLTGVVVFASLAFITLGVCRNAANAQGEYVFFSQGSQLVFFAVTLWGVASFGGLYRKTCLPDAALAIPESDMEVDMPESLFSMQAVRQCICCIWTRLRP